MRRGGAWTAVPAWTLAAALACALPAARVRAEALAIEPPRDTALYWGAARVEPGAEGADRFVRVRTTGSGELAYLADREPYDPPLDFSGRFPCFRIRVDDPRELGAMEFRLSSDDGSSYFSFPVPLYADVEFNPLQSDAWLDLSLSFGGARTVGSPIRSEIRRIAWLLRDRGGSTPAVADWGGVSGVELPPRGVLSLSFDDGYDEHYRVAAPAMEARGFRGTAYVMPDQVGEVGYMTLEELHALHDRYGWDVAAHHFTPLTEFAPAQLERTLRGVRRWLHQNGFGGGADHLAYPLGKLEAKHVLPLVRRHFATARLASAGPETLPPGDPHRLRAMNVLSATSPAEIGAAARRAREHREWLILMFHYLVREPRQATEYPIDAFVSALDEIRASGIEVRRVSEVWEQLSGR